ncbi:MAG: MinD/ParA family protein [Rhodospirillaceae bacterium]|jgi:flagellar biosynthesis protein FlhG|nr:MinD/ParA family protein [Rhodospirillaceae bacterium]
MALTPTDAPNSGTRRKIIAVASGKGGVGKTWFSVTLSHALSRMDRRALLFDGDLGLANVDIQLGLTPKHDLSAVIAGKLTLQQAITHYDAGGFDILAGRSGANNLTSIPIPKLKSLRNDLRDLAAKYDRVIIDLSAGVDRTVQTLATLAKTILVVTTDEPTSLTDAYAFIKLALRANPDTDIRIVVNMAETRNSGQTTYETLLNACKNFLQAEPPLAGIIRRDLQVRDSIRHQAGLLTRHPTADAASDVELIAKQFANSG